MFTKINANGTQNVLYAGETGSFRDRPRGVKAAPFSYTIYKRRNPCL